MNKYLRNKIIKNAICWPLIGAGIAGIAIGNQLLTDFESNITGILCPTVEDKDSKTDAASSGSELAVQIEEEGIVLVQNRGGTNGRGILPLSDSINKVNVFGRGAFEWHYSGTGSGGVMTGKVEHLNLIDALEEEGITVNQELISASKNKKSQQSDQSNLATSTLLTSRTFEPKISDYQTAYNNAKAFSDTAIICFGRYAGEGNDLLKQSIGLYGTDTERTTLDFSAEEEALVKQVAKDFKNVIVVINSSNVMNLEYVESVEGVDACLVVGTPGTVGARAIKNIIWGATVPSGHLADTFVYDFKTTPNFYNSGYDYMGIYEGSGKYTGAYAGCTFRDAKKDYRGFINPGTMSDGAHATYVDYTDGIYVGYRWYETADAEGFWDSVDNSHGKGYKGVVQYPFGYGLSYVSNFDWEIVKTSLAPGSTIDENTQLEVTVKVTNKDQLYSGKDVVQVYLTAPYDPTTAPIEKSYVSLVGFGKTQTLEPGQSEELTIKLDTWDFKSFDDYDVNSNNHKGYEMEAGDYVLRLRTDSHTDKVMSGGNTITYNVPTTIKIDKDRDTKAPIKPIMTSDNPVDGFAIDGSDSGQNIDYIKRANLRNKTYTLPTSKPADRTWNPILEVSKNGGTNQSFPHNVGNSDGNFLNENRWNTYSTQMARAWDNYGSTHGGKDPFGNDIPTTKPTFGASKKVALVDGMQLTEAGIKCAKDYNDPLWEEALDGVPFSTATAIISSAHTYNKPANSALGIPETSDHDGPSQINTSPDAGLASYLTGYPCPTVLAQSWNENLAFKMGKSYASDMTAIGVDCAYGFACNIHRTPFGGRNFEYFSEDPFLSGRQASQSCRGVQVSGKTTYLKHFVCNDQETWRCGVYTWMSEQAFREIYAKPFEYAIKDDSTTAIMSSFNRVGATWAGGSEAANQGMMRNEWGFHGTVKTDYGEDCDVMDFAQCIRAGETIGLSDGINKSVDKTVGSLDSITPRYAHRIREVAKEIAWTYIHALYLNKKYNEDVDAGLIDDEVVVATQSKHPWVWWKPTVFALETLIIGGMGLGAYFALRPLDKESIEESEGKKAKKEAK